MSDDNFQFSLFDDEIEKKSQSLDFITIDFETANQYGNSAISVGLVPFIEKTPGIPLVAHNAKFDTTVIWDACSFYHHKIPHYNYFCSLKVSKKAWPELEHHSLTFLGQKFGINYLAHDALEDSRTCGLVITLAAQKLHAASVEELLKKCGLKMETL